MRVSKVKTAVGRSAKKNRQPGKHILIGGEQKHAEQQGKAHYLSDGLRSLADRAAFDFFDDQEGEQSAVDDGDRQKIHDRKVSADDRQEPDEFGESSLGDFVTDAEDANRDR